MKAPFPDLFSFYAATYYPRESEYNKMCPLYLKVCLIITRRENFHAFTTGVKLLFHKESFFLSFFFCFFFFLFFFCTTKLYFYSFQWPLGACRFTGYISCIFYVLRDLLKSPRLLRTRGHTAHHSENISLSHLLLSCPFQNKLWILKIARNKGHKNKGLGNLSVGAVKLAASIWL